MYLTQLANHQEGQTLGFLDTLYAAWTWKEYKQSHERHILKEND